MNIKLRIIISLCLGLTTFIAIIMLSTSLREQANKINQAWNDSSKIEVKKSEYLSDIVIGFGYGGFIHNFKNMVLRKDINYAKKSREMLDKTDLALKKYLSLDIDKNSHENILSFQETVDRYREMFELAQTLIRSNKTAEQIDEKVKVDDAIALKALGELITNIKMSTKKTANDTSNKLGVFNSQLRNGFALLIILSIIAFSIVIHSLICLEKGYSEINILFQGAPYAIMGVNNKGIITQANKQAINLFGFSEAMINNIQIEDLVPDEFKNKHIKYRKDFQKSEKIITMNDRKQPFFGKKTNGELFPASISISTYFAAGKKCSIVLVKDLTHENKLKKEAETDNLTSIPNRRAAEEFFYNVIHRSKRYKTNLSIIMCDIDYFKRINDTYGHDAGDHVLTDVSRILASNIRNTDFICRWGGEEFLILSPDINAKEAYFFAEKLRALIQSNYATSEIQLTLSMGVTEFNFDDDQNSFIKRADRALYKSKDNGRNMTTAL